MPQASDTTEDPGADDIMSPGDIKAILAVARRGRPVNCAVALTGDKDGLILLDRKVKPKRLAANLRKQCADAGIELQLNSARFDRASVDIDEDAALDREEYVLNCVFTIAFFFTSAAAIEGMAAGTVAAFSIEAAKMAKLRKELFWRSVEKAANAAAQDGKKLFTKQASRPPRP